MIMRHRISLVAAALAMLAGLACDTKDDGTRRSSGTRRDDRTVGTRDQTRDDMGRTTTPPADTRSDEAFLTKAAQANFAEIEAGALCEAKATNAEVKKFGQHMVEDHSKANRELTEMAVKKGFRLPSRPDDSQMKEIADLAKLSGADFDKKYAAMMVSDHQKAVALFEENAQSAKDGDVRAWAEKTVPTLREHLKMARDLNDKVTGAPAAD